MLKIEAIPKVFKNVIGETKKYNSKSPNRQWEKSQWKKIENTLNLKIQKLPIETYRLQLKQYLEVNA